MPLDPQTFRSRLLSLYQSAVDTAVRARLPADAPRPGLENETIRAGAQVATFQSNGVALPLTAPPNITQDAWTAARLAYQFVQATLSGQTAAAAAAASDLKGSVFDPGWVETVTEYLQYFGVDGAARRPHYRPPSADMPVLRMPAGAVVGLLADWGIGTAAAVALAEQMAQFKPDVVIHLGDIYYSGTPDECRRNFADILDRILDRRRVPIYTLSGNHDMYCGGVGYYGLLDTLNAPPLASQPASFFCLRSADDAWQFLAMDTGRFDVDPLDGATVLVGIEPAEADWLAGHMQDFAGRTILLSHHQLFSAFSQIGPAGADGKLCPFNPKLRDVFARFTAAGARGGGIAAWYWGHEHTLSLYAPYLGLGKGRCIGHGAIPVLIGDGDHPLTKLADPPVLLTRPLGDDGPVHAHGFALLQFGQDGSCRAEYYNDNDRQLPFYSESLGGAPPTG